MAGGRTILSLDLHELSDLTDRMQRQMAPEKFDKLMHDSLYDAGRKAKTIIKRAATKDYAVGANWIGQQIRNPRIEGSGSQTRAVIPLSGYRGIIGPRYKLARSGRPTNKKGKRYKINAHITRKQTSTLPTKMEHQGGNPPFIAKGNGGVRAVFTRHNGKMVRVPGVGAPQMITNLSEDAIRKELLDYTRQRMEHHFERMMDGI